MKNKIFIIFLLILLSSLSLLLLPQSTSAAEPSSVLSIGCLSTKAKSLDNWKNWPAGVKSQFRYEFYKVFTDCSKCGYTNWVVYYTVVGKGSVGGKDCTLLYEGVVVGNYDCEPPDLVIKDGKLVDTWHYINSRLVDWNQKYKQHDKGGNSNFLCHFICHGWNCVEGQERPCLKVLKEEGYDEKNIYCERWMWTDKDHDGKDDITGETPHETLKKKKDMWKKFCEERGEKEGKDCKFEGCWTDWVIKTYVKETSEEQWEMLQTMEYEEFLEKLTYLPEETVYELCVGCSCIEFEQWPKTTVREGDRKKAEKRLKKLEKADLLRNMDQARVTPQFKSTGVASGHVANLTVTSNADELLTFGLKNTGLEGMLLVNPIEEEGNLVVATIPGISVGPTSYKTADSVTLNPNESITFPVMGYCANFDKENPSGGIELTLGVPIGVEPTEECILDGLLGDTPQTAVIDTLEATEFPQSFTPEDVITTKQIALWASQPENKDKTPEDYETRGYPIKEDYIPIIRDVLDQSGVNPDEIVALTGEKKEPEEPAEMPSEPEKPAEPPKEGFPWIYAVAAVVAGILAIVGVSVYKKVKK